MVDTAVDMTKCLASGRFWTYPGFRVRFTRKALVRVQRIAAYPRVEVSADGTGVVFACRVSAAGRCGRSGRGRRRRSTTRSGGRRRRCSAHAPGRVLADLAVMLADGGETIADLAVLRRPAGPVRAGGLDGDGVAGPGLGRRHRAGRAEAARARGPGAGLAAARRGRPDRCRRCGAPGTVVPGLVIDIDATLVTCHSEKEGTAPTFKHGFGYHPLLAWLDNTGEALAGMLRPGNAEREHRRRPHQRHR